MLQIREKLDSISLVQQSDELKQVVMNQKEKIEGENTSPCGLFISSLLCTGTNIRTMNHISKRYVALKVMYFGPRYFMTLDSS
ncbi:hypothetical protein CK203_103838 [Vitis vinifera]|uniref:Uncharacterized protein n=1 Tax=Vitis vinifera TaxID=29760 RepID=A0A438CHL1_VITVI|nr:hypothetical protein CK203_103838 [Vitis vinifera]